MNIKSVSTCIGNSLVPRNGTVRYALMVGWLFWGLSLTAPWDSMSVYIGSSLREREKEERKDRREKIPNNSHPHLLQAQ